MSARGRVIWWNVQRLFHYEPSALAAELGASAERGWTRERYELKIRNLAAVLRHIGGDGADVAIAAFAEVQNAACVADLLAAAGWGHLVEASSPQALDGYDVAVAYNPAFFRPGAPARAHNVHQRFGTRDILEVELLAADGAELLLLVHHWPSRRISNSEALRIGLGDHAARLVKRWLQFTPGEMIEGDRLRLPERERLEARWRRPVLHIGDFNDEPFDASVAQLLRAVRQPEQARKPLRLPQAEGLAAVESYLTSQPRCYNPTWALLAPTGDHPPGTYLWNGQWYLLDQALLSQGALFGSVRYVPGSLRVVGPRAVELPEGGELELRTRAGAPRAFDLERGQGVSDHLPLCLELDLPGRA